MPDYIAHLAFRAPNFGRAEYRMLQRQLTQRLADDERVLETRCDARDRAVSATIALTASSSSRARADAAAAARTATVLLRRVRASAVEVSVEVESRAPNDAG